MRKNDKFTYFNLLILCMWLHFINKVKVTHQGEGHIKVKEKYLHPFHFYVVCIRLKCILVIDKFLMYHNGTLVVNSHRNHGRAVRLNPVKKLVFSSTDVRTGGGNCNCEVDNVRIFEVALSSSEIRDLVDHG